MFQALDSNPKLKTVTWEKSIQLLHQINSWLFSVLTAKMLN